VRFIGVSEYSERRIAMGLDWDIIFRGDICAPFNCDSSSRDNVNNK
jgi:hypothetical protein